MAGILELEELLHSLAPAMNCEEWVFCTVTTQANAFDVLQPAVVIHEEEGTTLVLTRLIAERHGLAFDGVFRQITLTVHSSLQAVGLTAVVASALARRGISANMVAGYYHDHVFVPADRAEEAISVLHKLAAEHTEEGSTGTAANAALRP